VLPLPQLQGLTAVTVLRGGNSAILTV